MTSEPVNELETIARKHCAKLFDSAAAKRLPKDQAEALIIVAFTLGAAWGLDRPDMLELADAQIDSTRAANNGALT